MANTPHTDFTLPSLSTPGQITKAIMLQAITYSIRWNSPRHEYISYGFWNLVMNALVDDYHSLPGHCSCLAVVPQYELVASLNDYSSDSDEEANTSFETDPQSRDTTRAIFPDLAIVRIVGSFHNPLHDNRVGPVTAMDWPGMYIHWIGVPLIVEAKRPISRTRSKMAEGLVIELDTAVGEAALCAVRQAKYLFCATQGQKQESVVLLAVTGEYWIYMVATPYTEPEPDSDVPNWELDTGQMGETAELLEKFDRSQAASVLELAAQLATAQDKPALTIRREAQIEARSTRGGTRWIYWMAEMQNLHSDRIVGMVSVTCTHSGRWITSAT